MVLEEFSVEIGPILAAAGIVGLHLVLEVNILSRYYFWSFIILENQYRIGDVVKFDNAGGTRDQFKKNNFRDLDGTVHHIPHGEIKKVSIF
jgi:small conductance mechanosensitive channel